MYLHEWNSLQVGGSVCDSKMSHFLVCSVEPVETEAAWVLLDNRLRTFWTQDFPAYEATDDIQERRVQPDEAVDGGLYWLATKSSSLPIPIKCLGAAKARLGWIIDSNEGAFAEREIVGVFPWGIEGFLSACSALIDRLETAIRFPQDLEDI